ncbi:MAG: Hpt domain-containing protein [Spirochaetales bacterium]|nr:Hpt domain-containing protein [Spirochaetales bacterium]
MTIDDLRRFGADTDEGIRRCMGNEGFYLRLVKMMPNDQNFAILFDAIEKGDLDTAFEAAHALKGALGNLSITSLLDPVLKITDLLRSRTRMDYSDLVSEIRKKHHELVELCGS